MPFVIYYCVYRKIEKMQTEIIYRSIGVIKTPYKRIADMPIQPKGAQGIEGIVELIEEFTPGLIDLEGFSHIILLYHFHMVKGYNLSVVPFMDNKPHGIFATRAPVRSNSIGISIVKLKKVEDNQVYFEGADMLNDTPLIDIKPYFPKYDSLNNASGAG